jgi:hypothetical protein
MWLTLLMGLLPLIDAWRTELLPPLLPIEIRRWWGTEQQELKDPLAGTVTIQNNRVVARDGQPVPFDSASSAAIIEDLRQAAAAVRKPRASWFGVDSWLGKSFEVVFGLLFLGLGIAGWRRVYRARFAPDFKQWVAEGALEAPIFAIEAHQLRLLRPYPFAASSLADRDMVAASELSEISSWGDRAVLAGRELVFFTYAQRDAVLAFARRNAIPIVDRPDSWLALTYPLYNQQDANNKANNRARLRALGIGAGEAWQIRWQLRCWRSCQPWYWSISDDEEELIFDHFTVLHLTGTSVLPRRRWYWYTMALALRTPIERTES